jgi:integrase
MTASTMSRSPFNPSPALSDVLNSILTDGTLAARRRQDLASALRTLAKALGKSLDELPAHPGRLRERLAAFSPDLAGISHARWVNVKSLTRFALSHSKLSHVPGRYREELVEAWEVLFGRLQTAQARFGLSRFCHYCSKQGTMPEQVDHQVFAAFLDDLLNAGLVDAPRKIHRTACILWNQAAITIVDWPRLQVTVPNYTRTYALSWETFPASLKLEYDTYLKHLGGGGVLDTRAFKPLRPGSVATRGRQLHEFVSAAVHGGRNPAALRSFSDLVDVGVVRAALGFILGRANPGRDSGVEEKSTVQAHQMAQLLRSIARHWVKVKEDHLAELKKLCVRTDTRQHGLSDKNRTLLRQFDDPAAVDNLMCLPEDIVAELKRTKTISRAAALQMQVAVAIELLLMSPIRIGNLAGLNLDTHLIRYRKSGMRLSIRGCEVKNDWNIEALLAPETVELIDLYLVKFRPLLSSVPSPWLFPGENGQPKSTDMLRTQIKDCVRKRIGLQMNPHFFRHFAGDHYLKAHPGAYGVVRLLLGHKSINTTTKYYCDTNTVQAGQIFNEHVLRMRAARRRGRQNTGADKGAPRIKGRGHG